MILTIMMILLTRGLFQFFVLGLLTVNTLGYTQTHELDKLRRSMRVKRDFSVGYTRASTICTFQFFFGIDIFGA